jgi:NAD(P)-dependent dehydrogenase (short-subunit alcohol dehydrogenase family)
MAYLEGLRTVVTGAGSGIGAALARRLAAEGAQVVVNDVDAASAARVAAEIGGLPAAGDAASEEGVAALIAMARAELGGIDLYCANAGVAAGRGLEAPEADWDRSWQVNVMAHVRAVRLLLPDWLGRGRGHFLATVSAAGLLTMPGAAPYAVTKHAALAFAEWVAVTYGDRGVRVQALCPQGVRTPMLTASGEVGRLLLEPGALEPDAVADLTVSALEGGPFLVLPHPEVARYYADRAADPDAWQAAMRRLNARLSSR